MTEDNFEPKRLGRTDSGRVIVFDPVNQTLKTAKLSELDVKQASIQPAPKWSSRVKIYEQSPDSKRMIATLNLDKLDWLANIRRHIGLISEIYVMGAPATTIAVT